MRIWCVVVIALLALSCSHKKEHEKYQYDYLKRQLTPDRKHYIYTYKREGNFVTSNDISGRRLIGVNKHFEENAGTDVDGVIDHWSKDTLVVHTYHQNYEQPKDTFIVKTEYETYDGIIIKKIYEHPIVGGGYADEFDFDSVKIENNRVKFYGAKSKFGSKKYSGPEISFPSGEFTVYSDSGFVTKIEYDKQFKDMDFSRIDNSGKWLHHQPEVEIKSYVFTPRKKININNLGEMGVFRDY